MDMARRFRAAALAAGCLALAPHARADGTDCRVVTVDFVPGDTLTHTPMRTPLQIVAWLEDASGKFVDTVYITQQTGTFGLGNRPGRFDFNSGPMWPYGRRTTVFPVWAHRHGLEFAQVVFQDGRDSELSHDLEQSSSERHYCKPLRADEGRWAEADAGTCASTIYTDKGTFSAQKSLYPPRADLARDAGRDSGDVAAFAQKNPFDAVSGATPVMGAPAEVTWSVPPTLPAGDYVLWIETSREFDHNETYSELAYPAPTITSFADWGRPYRGQPSVLYKVPIAIAWSQTSGTTASYAGYGDPTGDDGDVRPPDATITSNVVGSGAQRFAMAPGGYRVRAVAQPEPDFALPGAPAEPLVVDLTDRSATIEFVAPGDDGTTGKVKGYEVRMAVGTDITEDGFDGAMRIADEIKPVLPGAVQQLALKNLLFETDYVVAIRAVDNCRNAGPITLVKFRTHERASGEVDACFVATAAYGSPLAADVGMLCQFRDAALRQSVLGELAVEAYYTFGPAVAGAVSESDLLRATARAALAPIVAWARLFRP